MKKVYTRDEKIAFYSAKLAALKEPTLREQLKELQSRVWEIENFLAKKTGTKEG